MGRISSHSYIAMEAKVPEEDAPRYQNGNLRSIQIPTRIPQNCDHTAFICLTKECVNGWAIDHKILFDRTIAGRRFKEELGR